MNRWVPWTIIGAVVVAGGIWWAIAASSTPAQASQLDGFAQCLKNSGTTFYGAWWCPHCKNQKELFGTSVQYLPYVECSSVDGKSQLPVCTQKGVKSYPTWQFKNGPLQPGEETLQELSTNSGCALPGASNANVSTGNANTVVNTNTNANQ